jgi:hypothetical protein
VLYTVQHVYYGGIQINSINNCRFTVLPVTGCAVLLRPFDGATVQPSPGITSGLATHISKKHVMHNYGNCYNIINNLFLLASPKRGKNVKINGKNHYFLK